MESYSHTDEEHSTHDNASGETPIVSEDQRKGDFQMKSTGPLERDFSRSADYIRRAAKHLAGGVSSNVRLGAKPTPLCFKSASGSKLIDIDGNEYIDYVLGMGPVILGHDDSCVKEKIVNSLRDGQLFGGQHQMELELAEMLCAIIPSAELVRFGLTGSEMVQAALRVARAFTGKTKFVKFEGHYHGWYDNVLLNLSSTPYQEGDSFPIPAFPQSAGQPDSSLAEVLVLPWNDTAVLRQCLDKYGSQVAAIIMEPVMCNTGAILPADGYLQSVRQLCDEHEIVLIFDEVITGFRLDVGGVQARLNVTPDIALFAKAMGNGFPIAALVGKRDIMSLIGSGKVNHSGTYNSNVLSIAASLATVERLSEQGAVALRYIERMGDTLIAGIRAAARSCGRNLHIQGYGAVFNTAFMNKAEATNYSDYRASDAAMQTQFVGALLHRGIRITDRGTWFMSLAHSDRDIAKTISLVEDALRSLVVRPTS